jgi:putative ABC transport system ATP-binding protein
VEFVERGEGDVLSRLSVDTSIVGERLSYHLHCNCRRVFMRYYSVTQNLSDGLRSIVMSSVGCECLVCSSIIFHVNLPPVGAMFYLSPTLTLLMLAVVPPVSLGAVRLCRGSYLQCSYVFSVLLW